MSALAGMIFDHDGPLMIFDDAIRNRKTQTRARSNLFRREEWVKDALLKIRRDARTGILTRSSTRSRLQRTGDGDDFMRTFSKASRAFVRRLINTCSSWMALPITITSSQEIATAPQSGAGAIVLA